MMMLFLRFNLAMYTSADHMYARVGVRDPAHMYVCGRIFFLAHWPLYVRVHATCTLYYDTCAPLHRPVCMYTFATRMTTLRTVRPGGSQQSGGRIIFFSRTHFLACEDVAGGSQQSGANVFFAKYGGMSGGSPLSGGGIIILHVIRRHFLAAAVDRAVILSTYSPRPMEVVP